MARGWPARSASTRLRVLYVQVYLNVEDDPPGDHREQEYAHGDGRQVPPAPAPPGPAVHSPPRQSAQHAARDAAEPHEAEATDEGVPEAGSTAQAVAS